MNRWFAAQAALLGAGLLFVAGCGNTCSIQGQVNFNGQPVKDGFITFTPADGKGPIKAGPIKDGRYSVGDLAPGPRVVLITGTKDVPFARSSAEMAKMAEQNKSKGDGTGIIDRADIIAPEDEGNGVTVELVSGNQSRDFDIKSKAAAK